VAILAPGLIPAPSTHLEEPKVSAGIIVYSGGASGCGNGVR
jgi:hypothetical protein